MYRLRKLILILHDLSFAALAALARRTGLGNSLFGSGLNSLRGQTAPLAVCIVCKGNICRSPYAAERLRQLAAERRKPPIFGEIFSRGIATTPEKCADPSAIAAAARRNFDLSSHRTKPLGADDIERADLLLVPDCFVYWRLLRRCPQARSKAVYLAASSARRGYRINIADPYGQSDDAFDACYKHVDRALEALIEELSTPPGHSNGIDAGHTHSEQLRGQRILLLDGNQRSALAVTRSLGRLGAEIIVGSTRSKSLAGCSRYANSHVVYPDPLERAEDFDRWLLETLQALAPSMLLPVTDASLRACYRSESKLRALTQFPFVQQAIFEQAADKAALAAIARSLGIAVPQTATLSLPIDPDRKLEAYADFPFPAVIKPARSGTARADSPLPQVATYLETPAELAEFVESLPGTAARQQYLLQQRIGGAGVGVFAVCREGDAAAYFCHRRILEKPPSGGVSVLSESISAAEAPLAESLALLAHLKWDGAAMLEYKVDSGGRFYLLEINPRFWGSLQLAIDCGRNFPEILARCFLGGESAAEAGAAAGAYRVGRRLRWELGTLDHFLIRLRSDPRSAIKSAFSENSLQFFARGKISRGEIFRREDPAPFFCEAAAWIRGLIK